MTEEDQAIKTIEELMAQGGPSSKQYAGLKMAHVKLTKYKLGEE